MIRISCGNLGSGKTLSEVREMVKDTSGRLTYSNIHTKIRTQKVIKPEMLLSYETVEKGGKKKERVVFNKKFWQDVKKPINIVLDEAHFFFSSRRSMSNVNLAFSKFVSMARRICGQDTRGYGSLVFITQLPHAIDRISRDLCNEIRHHTYHYVLLCKKCKAAVRQNTELQEQMQRCIRCGSWHITRLTGFIEVRKFSSMEEYMSWKEMSMPTFYSSYTVRNVHHYFPLYNSLQWEDIFEDYY